MFYSFVSFSKPHIDLEVKVSWNIYKIFTKKCKDHQITLYGDHVITLYGDHVPLFL